MTTAPAFATSLPVAVVLCGCGRADGSEIHESVSILIHLARLGVGYRCFAPDVPQTEVVNHATGATAHVTRNCMVEAARISRGEIAALATLRAADFAALFFPGGFGAAKNLCTFARDGAKSTVIPEVRRVILEFHAASKPIGLCCIAPVLAAQVLGKSSGGPGCEVTMGQPGPAAEAVVAWGAQHVSKSVEDAHVDRQQRIVTTPAYMDDRATPYQVFTGIGAMVEQTLTLVAGR